MIEGKKGRKGEEEWLLSALFAVSALFAALCIAKTSQISYTISKYPHLSMVSLLSRRTALLTVAVCVLAGGVLFLLLHGNSSSALHAATTQASMQADVLYLPPSPSGAAQSIPADTDTVLWCNAPASFPIGNPGDARVWMYEFTMNEANDGFAGSYSFSGFGENAPISSVPRFTRFTAGKFYFVHSDKDLSFQCGTGVSPAVRVCDCGQTPPVSRQRCPDQVNYFGPSGQCLQHADGTCNWEMLQCPPPVQSNLIIAYTGPTSTVMLDDTTVYALTVRNAGPGVAEGVIARFNTPSGFRLQSAQSDPLCRQDAAPYGGINCGPFNLNNGDAKTLQITIKVTGFACEAPVNTQLSANSNPNTDSNLANNVQNLSLTVRCPVPPVTPPPSPSPVPSPSPSPTPAPAPAPAPSSPIVRPVYCCTNRGNQCTLMSYPTNPAQNPCPNGLYYDTQRKSECDTLCRGSSSAPTVSPVISSPRPVTEYLCNGRMQGTPCVSTSSSVTPAPSVAPVASPSEPVRQVSQPAVTSGDSVATREVGACVRNIRMTTFTIPGDNVATMNITTGRDGNLWFAEQARNAIARMTPSGTITHFPIRTAGSAVRGMASGPDGNIWFTEINGNTIGRITMAGIMSEFPLPPGNYPGWITAGPDGNVWFTAQAGNKIGRITTDGDITYFNRPDGSNPSGITTGPDGNIWFTQRFGSHIVRITPGGTIKEIFTGSMPFEITGGPDGNVWFTDGGKNSVSRVTPDGIVTDFPIPTPNAGPAEITLGFDGKMWFAEDTAKKIGRISLDGVVTEYPVPASIQNPSSITLGHDGNLWFTGINGNAIVKIEPCN